MTNWCSNTVVFEGKPEAIEQIQQLFKSMVEKEQKEECGQLPEFVSEHNGGYFFEIYQNDDVTGVFQYETKWSPNIVEVQKIAEHYNVNFTQDYLELGNCVCGRATSADKLLTDVFWSTKILNSSSLTKKLTPTILRAKITTASTKF